MLLGSAIFQFRDGDEDTGLSSCNLTLDSTCFRSGRDEHDPPGPVKDWLKLSFDDEGVPAGLTVIIATDNGPTLIHEYGLEKSATGTETPSGLRPLGLLASTSLLIVGFKDSYAPPPT